jgi:type VI secretion system secreted protein VgrG
MAEKRVLFDVRLQSDEFSCDGLTVVKLEGREAISEPFVFDVDVDATPEAGFDPATTLGTNVRIVFHLEAHAVRSVSGMVAETTKQLHATEGTTRHRLRIVPRLCRLSLSSACEVYLDQSIEDITRLLFQRAALTDHDLRTRFLQPPEPRDFRLQYAETNLTFVSRHLERAGIAYSFDHSTGKDVLVLSDTNQAFDPASDEPIPYIGPVPGVGITELKGRNELVTTTHTVLDYDEDHPKLELTASHDLVASAWAEPFGGQIIDFCAGHATRAEGQKLATQRAEFRRALGHGIDGASNVKAITAGRTIQIEGLHLPGQWLVAWVEHHFEHHTEMQGAGATYRNTFRILPMDWHYSPPFLTPWPRIAGFVHAVTETQPPGASGRIAQLDPEGRYTVRFLFDRARDGTSQQSSARVRMMQPHAGPGYGMHFPLKPGVEVLVGFIEGDPDRPIIAGAIPNALTVSPVTQVNAQMNRIETESGIRITLKDA